MNQDHIDVKSKKIKRLWLNSLEKDAIITGFKNLGDWHKDYLGYKEAQTRQISDWLIGMNGSPLYTLLLRQKGVRGVYSIGRVRTPTLYMVYRRDQAIKNFKPEPYFELNAEILANQQKFVAKLDPYQRFKDEAGLMTFMQAKHVQKGSQGGLIKDVQKQAKKSASPQLFSLSSLQSAMNKRYHASASQTLVANLTKYLGLVSKQVALTNTTPNKRYVNGKKVEEHYAIIMTKVVPTKEKLASLPKLQQQVYDLVLRTTLAMFADPYEYEETTIVTQVGD
jgi:DNA topoisomerase-3